MTTTTEGKVVHGFLGKTSVVAWCGAVERPTQPRITGPVAHPDSACPECVEAWKTFTNQK